MLVFKEGENHVPTQKPILILIEFALGKTFDFYICREQQKNVSGKISEVFILLKVCYTTG